MRIRRHHHRTEAKADRRLIDDQLDDWTVTVPAAFPTIEAAAIRQAALQQLDALTESGALDGTHSDLLDQLVSELMAPFYDAARVHFNRGVDILELVERNGIRELTKRAEAAEAAVANAWTSDEMAAARYEEVFGMPRRSAARHDALNWNDELARVEPYRVRFTADTGPLDYVRRTFRGAGDIPMNETHPAPTSLA